MLGGPVGSANHAFGASKDTISDTNRQTATAGKCVYPTARIGSRNVSGVLPIRCSPKMPFYTWRERGQES
jgi:hypothetical protein